MYSRAEQYRRRGTEAQQRAAQTTDLGVKEAFKDLARSWFALAKQTVWLDRERDRHSQQDDKKD